MLMKLTYTRLEGGLIRPRVDRPYRICWGIIYIFILSCILSCSLQRVILSPYLDLQQLLQ